MQEKTDWFSPLWKPLLERFDLFFKSSHNGLYDDMAQLLHLQKECVDISLFLILQAQATLNVIYVL